MATEAVKELLENNLLQQLGALPATGALAEARVRRDAATRHTQGSYQALFETIGDSAPALPIRLQAAAHVADLNANPELREHYQQLLHRLPHSKPLESPALEYAERVTLRTASATPAHLEALLAAGWPVAAIVTPAQVVAYVNFESRLLTGLRLLGGHAASPLPGRR